MTSDNQNEIEELRGRVEKAEEKLCTIKFILVVVGILVLALLIPPVAAVVGVGLLIALIVVSLLVYMYSIIWVCDRFFGDARSRSSDLEHSNNVR